MTIRFEQVKETYNYKDDRFIFLANIGTLSVGLVACLGVFLVVGLMMLNATFKNISVILWRSVLLVKETGVHRDLSQVTDKRFHIMYRVHLA
jgi:hypothetical protein